MEVCARLRRYLSTAFADRRSGMALARRLWYVLRDEGYAGVKRRLVMRHAYRLSRGTDWSVDNISDEVYRDKFLKLPQVINGWIYKYGGFAERDILDFGCGEGTTAIGIALQYQPSRVVGIDINADAERCLPLAKSQLNLDRLPGNLHFYRVEPGKLHNPSDRFDLIYAWSVFEHVDQAILPDVLGSLRDILKSNGVFFLQITPLYYSSDGSHLYRWVPELWGHLLNQHSRYYEKLSKACSDREQLASLWSMYRTLNRMTAPGLVDMIEKAGFKIVREYLTHDGHAIPPELRVVYREEALRTNQVVLVAKRR